MSPPGHPSGKIGREQPDGTAASTVLADGESNEPEQAAVACGLVPLERRGLGYLPAVHRAWWPRSLSVNYIASFGRPRP